MRSLLVRIGDSGTAVSVFFRILCYFLNCNGFAAQRNSIRLYRTVDHRVFIFAVGENNLCNQHILLLLKNLSSGVFTVRLRELLLCIQVFLHFGDLGRLQNNLLFRHLALIDDADIQRAGNIAAVILIEIAPFCHPFICLRIIECLHALECVSFCTGHKNLVHIL